MKQHKRSVSLLVANTFLKVKPNEYFDTPINKDGDKYNNHVLNLTWRPLWFARKYVQQFPNGIAGYTRAIEELDTLERFENPLMAAVQFGLLEMEIVASLSTYAPVFPTNQRFRAIH